jgi:hypothetical protein
MKEHSVTTVIAVDPDHLLSFVADLTNDVKWRHDLALSELVSGHAGERGSDYRQKGVTPGRDDPYLIELVDVDRSGRIATFATVDRRPVAFGGRYRIVDTGGGAEITFAVWVRAQGMLRLIAPFMGKAVGKAVRANSERYLSDLRVLLEAT